jgi:MFS family permease
MAAQDVAVDAYAVENMNERERPLGTSLIMFFALTATVLGMGVVALVDRYGWKPTMLTSALLLTGFALPAIIRKEPPPPEARQKRMDRGERPSLIKLMKRKDSWYIMPYIFGFGFAEAFFRSMMLPFLVDKGMTLTQIGILLPFAALSGNGVAAVLTPVLIKRIGLKRTALIGLCWIPVEAAVFCTFALMYQLPPLPFFIPIIAATVFGVSLYSITVNNSRFRWASKTQSGTDYSLQGSIWNFGVSVAGSTAGFVAGAAGWPVFYIVSGIIGTSVAISYILMFDRVEDLVLQREQRELEG